MQTNHSAYAYGFIAPLAEARKLTDVKRAAATLYGRIDAIDVGMHQDADGQWTIDSRRWLSEDDPRWVDDVQFLDYKEASPSLTPGMVLDLYCHQLEIRGDPKYGSNMVGNVELTVEGMKT